MMIRVIQPGTWPPRKSSKYIHGVHWSGQGAGQGVGEPRGETTWDSWHSTCPALTVQELCDLWQITSPLGLSFFFCTMGLRITPTSQGCYDDLVNYFTGRP